MSFLGAVGGMAANVGLNAVNTGINSAISTHFTRDLRKSYYKDMVTGMQKVGINPIYAFAGSSGGLSSPVVSGSGGQSATGTMNELASAEHSSSSAAKVKQETELQRRILEEQGRQATALANKAEADSTISSNQAMQSTLDLTVRGAQQKGLLASTAVEYKPSVQTGLAYGRIASDAANSAGSLKDLVNPFNFGKRPAPVTNRTNYYFQKR